MATKIEPSPIPQSSRVHPSGAVEFGFTRMSAALVSRCVALDNGAVVTLIAYDPARDLYVYAVTSIPRDHGPVREA